MVLQKEKNNKEDQGQRLGVNRQQAGKNQTISPIKWITHQRIQAGGVQALGFEKIFASRGAAAGEADADDTDELSGQGQQQSATSKQWRRGQWLEKEDSQYDERQGRETAEPEQEFTDAYGPWLHGFNVP